MNRVKIKKEAREMLKGNVWNILKPILIIALITGVVGAITGGSSGGTNYEIVNGTLKVTSESPSLGAGLLSLAVSLAMLPIEFGLLVYIVKFVRKQPYELKELFAHYKEFWPIFCLNFLIGLFVTLWSLLFIIPGIIAAISYTMAMLIMVDGETDAMACIRKSKAMMKGYKWDYVVFQLSFILWHLLGIVTLGIAYLYVGPYLTVAEVLYYEDLKEVNPVK